MARLLLVLLLAVSSLGLPCQAGESKKLRMVVFGGHSGDPEAGAGGLIALLTQQGHEVIAAYATAYTDEANASCKRMGVTPKLFDFDPKKMYADEPTLRVVSAWLDEVKPDIVVTHWPLDSHPHHHVLSSLVWQCYSLAGPELPTILMDTRM
jgi:LmbE family N-acetylglucosaminyl deacetylase